MQRVTIGRRLPYSPSVCSGAVTNDITGQARNTPTPVEVNRSSGYRPDCRIECNAGATATRMDRMLIAMPNANTAVMTTDRVFVSDPRLMVTSLLVFRLRSHFGNGAELKMSRSPASED